MDQIKNKKNEFNSEIELAIQDKMMIIAQNTRMELTLSQISAQLSSKKETLSLIEREIVDAKKRLESTRTEEFDLKSTYKNELSHLSEISTEIAQSEGIRSAALLLQKETYDFYKIKKETFTRELELLEVAHQAKISQLGSEFQSKKLQWESEFKSFCEGKENDFKFHLEALDSEDLEEIKRKKSELLFQVVELVVKQSLKEGFSSLEQKSNEARKEVETIFNKVFGKTNRWGPW
jgi:hypothetical protein